MLQSCWVQVCVRGGRGRHGKGGLGPKIPDEDSGSGLASSALTADSCVLSRKVTPGRGAFSSHVNHWLCDHQSPCRRLSCGLRELSAVTVWVGHEVSMGQVYLADSSSFQLRLIPARATMLPPPPPPWVWACQEGGLRQRVSSSCLSSESQVQLLALWREHQIEA